VVSAPMAPKIAQFTALPAFSLVAAERLC